MSDTDESTVAGEADEQAVDRDEDEQPADRDENEQPADRDENEQSAGREKDEQPAGRDEDDGTVVADKPPFKYVRAMLLTMPVAILAGTVVSPPDAVAQLLVIALTFIVGLPISVRLVGRRRYGPRRIGLFYGAVLVGVLLGLWLLDALAPLPVAESLARFAVLALALLLADVLSSSVLGG